MDRVSKGHGKVDRELHVMMLTLYWYYSLGIFIAIYLLPKLPPGELYPTQDLTKAFFAHDFSLYTIKGVALQISSKLHLCLKLCAREHAFCMEVERLKGKEIQPSGGEKLWNRVSIPN